MAWKKLAFEEDVATLSDVIPQATDGTAGAAGAGTKAARDDHVHALGPLVADFDLDLHQSLDHVVEKRADWPAHVGSEGQMIYYTNDDRIYIYTVA